MFPTEGAGGGKTQLGCLRNNEAGAGGCRKRREEMMSVVLSLAHGKDFRFFLNKVGNCWNVLNKRVTASLILCQGFRMAWRRDEDRKTRV